MIREFVLTTAALSAIIALRYLLVAGVAHWALWRGGGRGAPLNRRPPSAKTVRHEITSSLIASPIYALPVAAVLVAFKHGGTALYLDPRAHGWGWLPASAVIYVLAHDAYYYWLHRLMHHPRLFAWSHRGHHLSRDPSAFAAFSFDPAEAAMTAWFLPALALVVPIQIGVALGLLMLMTAMAVLNHAGREVWPATWLAHPVGRAIITARHHDLHHKRLAGNYGLYFSLWDRLMGTELAPRPSVAALEEGAAQRGAASS